MKVNYQEVLEWFQDLLKDKIEGGSNFYKDDFSYILNEKKKKLIFDSYGKKIANALEDISKLSRENQKNIELLIQLYTSEAFRYFFRLLEDGEVSDNIGRINFKLTAVNDTTGEETLLISADEKDEIDNDFQGWILDNCIETEEDNN